MELAVISADLQYVKFGACIVRDEHGDH
jgi:hypothetical protein